MEGTHSPLEMIELYRRMVSEFPSMIAAAHRKRILEGSLEWLLARCDRRMSCDTPAEQAHSIRGGEPKRALL